MGLVKDPAGSPIASMRKHDAGHPLSFGCNGALVASRIPRLPIFHVKRAASFVKRL
jgi:hypothetical protein